MRNFLVQRQLCRVDLVFVLLEDIVRLKKKGVHMKSNLLPALLFPIVLGWAGGAYSAG
jgi:hypothetical protein